MGEPCIPTVDLSPFFRQDEDGREKAMQEITQASSQYGFFQIVNHGIPLDLMRRCLELSRTFFDYPDEEKHRSSPSSDGPLPAGYSRHPSHSPDKSEYLLIFPPGSNFNVYPQNPPGLRSFAYYVKGYREVMEEIFQQLSKMGMLLESIINECLGLPPNFLKEFNHDRSWDFMAALRYFPASDTENNGITEHADGNSITFVLQDEVGGLEVLHNGQWIPVIPAQDTIVVNIADVIQVLSNNKFKSGIHRVVRTKGRSRYSYGFFYNLHGDKWVEPLPQFTKEIGEAPKYRGFLFKQYQQLRMRNKTHPPSRPEDVIHITHYAITS